MLQDILIMYIPPSGTTQYVKHTWASHIDNQCVGYIHFFVETEDKIKLVRLIEKNLASKNKSSQFY